MGSRVTDELWIKMLSVEFEKRIILRLSSQLYNYSETLGHVGT